MRHTDSAKVKLVAKQVVGEAKAGVESRTPRRNRPVYTVIDLDAKFHRTKRMVVQFAMWLSIAHA